jgi:hypothetical protein
MERTAAHRLRIFHDKAAPSERQYPFCRRRPCSAIYDPVYNPGMSSQLATGPPNDGLKPSALSVSDFLPDEIARLSWVFDIGIRRMDQKQTAGWMPAMLVFCSLSLTLLLGAVLRLPLAVPLGIVGALDLLATRHFVGIGCRRLKQLGFMGPTRARWWFEVAAIIWSLMMSCGCFVVVHHKAALLGGWQQGLVELAFTCTKQLAPAFIVLAITGYFVGLARGTRVSGRALELVNFFFWMIASIGFAMWAIPQVPALAGWIPAAVGIVGVAVACLAGALEIRRRLAEVDAGSAGADRNAG